MKTPAFVTADHAIGVLGSLSWHTPSFATLDRPAYLNEFGQPFSHH